MIKETNNPDKNVQMAGPRELTTVPVSRKTKDRLGKHGDKGQTWDTVVNGVMDALDNATEGIERGFSGGIPLLYVPVGRQGSEPIHIGTAKCHIQEGRPPKITATLVIDSVYRDAIERALSTKPASLLENLYSMVGTGQCDDLKEAYEKKNQGGDNR